MTLAAGRPLRRYLSSDPGSASFRVLLSAERTP